MTIQLCPKPGKTLRKVIALALYCTSVAASAQGLNPPEIAGSYMGLTYPQGMGSRDKGENAELLLAEEDSTAMRLTIGKPWAPGVHLEYGLQKMTLTSSSSSDEGVHVGPLGSNVEMQMGSVSTMFFMEGPADFYPFLKLGVAAISAGQKQDFVGTTISAVGIVFPFTKGWSARVELERIDKLGNAGQSRTQAYAGIQIPI